MYKHQDPFSTDGIGTRFLYLVVFTIIFWISKFVVIALSIIQFLSYLFTGKQNDSLVPFCRQFSKYVAQTAAYLTFTSEHKPFPFEDWPEPEPAAPDSPGPAAGKATKTSTASTSATPKPGKKMASKKITKKVKGKKTGRNTR